MNVFEKFFIKLLLLFIIVLLLDVVIGTLLKIFYFKQDSGLQYRTTYSIEKTTADLLIFGSSTANHNYDPVVFEKSLHISPYNVGRDGNSIFYAYAVLKAILKRYSPKIVVLDFGDDEFNNEDGSYDRLSSLLPYYKTHPEIHPLIDLRSPYEKFKLLSSIYPYNSSIFTIAVGNTELNKKRRGDINGFIPLTKVWDEPIEDGRKFFNYDLDTNKIKVFDSFIRDCVEAKVELYIICSPIFIIPNYVSKSFVLGKSIANKYNLPFFDYSKDTTFLNHPGLFADIGHLNDKGVKIFSRKIAEIIQSGNIKQKGD